ncbi:hypothetical protein PsYK624_157730 [Phanerochaete sordida]|uniref:Uncharacterized protein n=1 Tax=Phanerochaete sordida TaxID=48140 RepID=A0A9P3LMM4_9APHY|nr:hypothetical protein PsYK624_157730 [Phanerochaete sordida]
MFSAGCPACPGLLFFERAPTRRYASPRASRGGVCRAHQAAQRAIERVQEPAVREDWHARTWELVRVPRAPLCRAFSGVAHGRHEAAPPLHLRAGTLRRWRGRMMQHTADGPRFLCHCVASSGRAFPRTLRHLASITACRCAGDALVSKLHRLRGCAEIARPP